MAALEDTTNASFLTEWPLFSYSATPPLTEFSVLPNLTDGLRGRTLRMVTLTVSKKCFKKSEKWTKEAMGNWHKRLDDIM